MSKSAIPQTWVEMVPKDVIAWRKLRASAWKLISGVSSGVRLREESLEWQKTSFKPIIIQDISNIYIDILWLKIIVDYLEIHREI